jgi:hypothetical protein
VQSYNTKIQQFPMSIVAKQGGFTDRPFFEIGDAAEREAPQVSFRSAARLRHQSRLLRPPITSRCGLRPRLRRRAA